jgi:hypothetical protein
VSRLDASSTDHLFGPEHRPGRWLRRTGAVVVVGAALAAPIAAWAAEDAPASTAGATTATATTTPILDAARQRLAADQEAAASRAAVRDTARLLSVDRAARRQAAADEAAHRARVETYLTATAAAARAEAGPPAIGAVVTKMKQAEAAAKAAAEAKAAKDAADAKAAEDAKAEAAARRAAEQAAAAEAAKEQAAASSAAASSTAATSAPAVAAGSVWDRLAECESGGNWAINTGNGYYGGLQFSLSSWRAVGGTGYPHQASRETQIAMGERLRAEQGWAAWPACSRKLGLR